MTLSTGNDDLQNNELDLVITNARQRHELERKLFESEKKYQNLFNLMAQGIVYQDGSGRIISANPAAERILGLSLAQLQGRTSTDPRWRTIHEDGSDFPGDLHPAMLALQTGKDVSNVIMGVYHPDKDEHVWIRVHARPQFVEGESKPALVIVTFEDITSIKTHQDGLRVSEARYRSLVETSPDGITLTNLQGGFLAANHKAIEMQGFSSFEELQSSGLSSFNFVSEPIWLMEPDSLLEKMLSSSPRQVEYSFRRLDGSCFAAEASLALLWNEAQQPYAILALFRDISARKQGEDQLRKLSQAVIQSGDAICITDPRGRIEYVNPQFEQITGYSLAESIGQSAAILQGGGAANQIFMQLWQTIKEGQIWRGDLQTRRKDGSLVWQEASIAPVQAESGVITSFVAIMKDVTGRKQLEQAMHIKDSAINSSINAMAMADLEGKLTYVNPSFLHLWGYDSDEEVLGKPVAHFWQEDAPVDDVFKTLFQGLGWQGELFGRKKDESLLNVDVSAHLVKDESGNPLCMMSTFVDITARKQAQAAEREEHRLSEALRISAEALSSSLKLNDVLELILENTGQVIANDSMTIMLLEGQSLKVVGHRGYVGRGLKNFIEKTDFSVNDFLNLKEMLETRQPSIVPDVLNNPVWKSNSQMDWIRSYAGVPICRRDEVIGFLNLDSSTPNFFTAAHARRLQAFASQAAVAIENARLYELDHLLSITDGLTGLYNSRYFFELAKLEFERSQRYPGKLSVIMIDVDHFKRVNDTFGHIVGDDVLREIARRLHSCLRVADVAARYGGEEFIILLTQTDLNEAEQAAERIRITMAERPFAVPGDESLLITVSLGVANLSEQHESLNQLVKSADDALYIAKASGRNQISIWEKSSV